MRLIIIRHGDPDYSIDFPDGARLEGGRAALGQNRKA